MILVTGARGVVGGPLCDRLQEQGIPYLGVSRDTQNDPKHNRSNAVRWDLQQSPSDTTRSQLSDVTTLIHCAPIWLLPSQLDVFKSTSLNRLIVFSSTSVLSKARSSEPSEQKLVEQLSRSERRLKEYCESEKLNLTILRPSMIYGYGRDQNIMRIARFIRKWRLMLLVGHANGQRQPVHVDDLIDVSLAILEANVTYGKSYNLAGKEVLTYREMVERIFIGLGKPSRIIRLPLVLFRVALRVASFFSGFAYTPEMADRMNQDLSYDLAPAQIDFDYRPQAFLTNPKRDLLGVL